MPLKPFNVRFVSQPLAHARELAYAIARHLNGQNAHEGLTVYPSERLEPMIFEVAMVLVQVNQHRARRPRLRGPREEHLDEAWKMIDRAAKRPIERFPVRLTPSEYIWPEGW